MHIKVKKCTENLDNSKKLLTFAPAYKQNDRDLAQLVAHTSGGREVAGSSPVIPTERIAKRLIISCLAIFLFRNSRGIPVIMAVRALKGEGCCYLSLS